MSKIGLAIAETHLRNDERADDFVTYTCYVIDMAAVRARYPFMAEGATEEAIAQQTESLAREKREKMAAKLNAYMANYGIRFGSTITKEEVAAIKAAKQIKNPVRTKMYDADHFADIGDGLIWHYTSFWLDGRYEGFVGYRKDEIMPLIEGLLALEKQE
ncbi:MAG: hypothetical protein JXK05_09575 [Campylobacterales bacterium]|nr:hypothetical protein [Campylobacterales bacterium]